jgi:molybdenum cofactor biosynthesis enzyme MoaA
MRLSADGYLQPCLFSQDRYGVSHLLGKKLEEEDIAARIREAVWKKPRGSKYINLKEKEYLAAYQGREEKNPLIHNLGG